MGDVSTHQEDSGYISMLGDTLTDGVAADMEGVRYLDLPIIGDVNGIGGIGGFGDVCCVPPEHSCTVHREQTHYGSVSGFGAAPWGAGVPEVVVTVCLGHGRDVRGGKFGINVGGGGVEVIGGCILARRLRRKDFCSYLIH